MDNNDSYTLTQGIVTSTQEGVITLPRSESITCSKASAVQNPPSALISHYPSYLETTGSQPYMNTSERVRDSSRDFIVLSEYLE